MSPRLTRVSSRRNRAGGSISASTAAAPTSPRTGATAAEASEPFRSLCRLRPTPTATSAAAGLAGGELSPEGGVFSNDFLIPLALDRRFGYRRDLADGFRIFQIGVNRGHHHARFDRNQVDSHQGHAHPRVDHDSFVEDAIEHVDETCAAW